MARSDLAINIILGAIDQASSEIGVVQKAVRRLREELDTSEFSRSAEGMRSFGEAAKGATQPMADAAKHGLALAGAITAITAALANKGYQSAKSYESAMADLGKVLDGGRQEAAAYSEQLNAMAVAYGQNGEALAQSMASFVQAGFTAKEALDLVEQSIRLMIAGEVDAAEASNGLVSILKGFGAPASEAAHAVDLLNEVSNKYATDVRQLLDGMRTIAPVAKQMGFSMNETAGLLTPIIEVFQSGTEAGDAFKTGLLRLVDDAKPVREALAQIGVAQKDANGNLRQGKAIFIDVARAFESLSDQQKIYFTGQLSGIDQAARMSTAFSNLNKYLEVTATAEQSAGSAMKEVEIRLQTAAYQAAQADEKFRQLAVTLGNTYKSEVAGVVRASGDLAHSFEQAVKAGDLNPLLQALKPQVQAIESLLDAISRNLGTALDRVDWSPLVDGIKSLGGEIGEALGSLFEGFDLRTTEGLQNAIQALINLLGNFSEYVGGIADGMGPMLTALNQVFDLISRSRPTISALAGDIEGLALSANTVIPAIEKVGSILFGSVGTVVEWTAKIGLAAAALGLLSRAGIPVLGILGNIAGRFLALNPAVAGLIASFTGLGGVVGALGAATGGAGFSLGLWANHAMAAAEEGTALAKVFDLISIEDEKVQRHLNSIDARSAAGLDEISQRTKVSVRSMQEFNAAVDKGLLVFDEASGKWIKGAGATAKLGAETERTAKTLKDLNAIAGANSSAMDAHTAATQDSAAAARKEADAWDKAAAARVTYGEWVRKSGDNAQQELEQASRLAAALGEQGEKVRALAAAYQQAQNYNNTFADGEQVRNTEALAQQLDEARQKYADLKAQLEQASPQVKVSVDDTPVQGVKKEVDALNGVTTYSDHRINTNAAQALSEIEQLANHDTTSTHTVYVRTVQANNAGGLIGALLASRGMAFKRPSWSVVPGNGNSDTVPAALPEGAFVLRQAAARLYGAAVARLNSGGMVNTLLTPGERIIDPATVRKYGAGFFSLLNRMELPPELLAGISAANQGPRGQATQAAAARDSVDLNLTVGGSTVQLQGARDQVRALTRALRELQRGR